MSNSRLSGLGRLSPAAKAIVVLALMISGVAGANAATTDRTYHGRIGRLMQDRCIQCHHTGGIAPFSMETYEGLQPYLSQIKVQIQSKKMPPWNAAREQDLSIAADAGDPTDINLWTLNFLEGDGPGKGFRGNRALSDEEIYDLTKWIDDGAEVGDPTDAPPAQTFDDSWQFGEPDLALEMPVSWTIYPGDPDIYRCFVLPTNFDENRVITSMDFHPTNNKIAHHAIIYLDPLNKGPEKDASTPEVIPGMGAIDGYDCFGGADVPGALPLGGWAPGSTIQPYSDQVGVTVPAHSNIIIQMHYNAQAATDVNGEVDRTRIGLKFAKKPDEVLQLIQYPLIAPFTDACCIDSTCGSNFCAHEFMIPPRVPPNDPVPTRMPMDRSTLYFTLPVNAHLTGIMPHMHLTGEEMHSFAIKPDGKIIPIINVDHWDFNWQNYYLFAEPVALPAGTTVFLEGVYVNNTDATVYGGFESYREMLLLTLAFVSDTDIPGLGKGGIPPSYDLTAPKFLGSSVAVSKGDAGNKVVVSLEYNEPMAVPVVPSSLDTHRVVYDTDHFNVFERITPDDVATDGNFIRLTFNSLPLAVYQVDVNAFHGVKDLAGNEMDANGDGIGGQLDDNRQVYFSSQIPAHITRQPADQAVRSGKNVIIGLAATGDGPLFINWYNTNLSNGTGATEIVDARNQFLYEIDGVNYLSSGFYKATVGNAALTPDAYEQTRLASLTIYDTPEPNGAGFVDDTFPDQALPGQVLDVSIRMRNTSRLTWSSTQGYSLKIVSDPAGLFDGLTELGFASPLDVAPANNQPWSFKGQVHAPMAPGSYQVQFQMSESSRGFFGPVVTTTLLVGDSFQVDFTNNSNGWTGGVSQGVGSVGVTAGGLCMTVPPTGDNIALWVSPEGYLPLVNDRVYEVSVTASTSQTNPNAIPLWDIGYDNFFSSGKGNNYGGTSWYLDVAGGANGVGRATGRTNFRTYVVPNAAETRQWQGLVDEANSAFSAQADAYNDLRLFVRVLDVDSGGYKASNDYGSICVKNLSVRGLQISSLATQTLWSPAIASATHAAETTSQAAELAGTATIDDPSGTANYALLSAAASDNAGKGARKTLLPYDPTQADLNSQLYPVVWTADTLLKGTLNIRSGVSGGLEGTDPLDAIFVDFDTPTNELGTINYTTSGSNGNMRLAASPRLSDTTGGASQPYIAFFYTHNVTATLDPNANRVRLLGDFFNTTTLSPSTSGADPFVVDGMKIESVTLP